MRLKLVKISTKSFILILSTINVIAGFILGAVVTVVSVLSPDEQNSSALGAWAIILFPILNGILGALTGTFLTGLYNFLAKRFGGIELEFESSE